MSNRRSLLPAILALVVLVPAFAGGSTASAAHQKRCVGSGSMTLGAGLSYFPTLASNVGFVFSLNCVEGGSVTGSGTFSSASCGRASGSGMLDSGKRFDIVIVGTAYVVLKGGIEAGNGVLHPIPDTSTIPFGNSCSSGTAKEFTITGSVCADTGFGTECLS